MQIKLSSAAFRLTPPIGVLLVRSHSHTEQVAGGLSIGAAHDPLTPP